MKNKIMITHRMFPYNAGDALYNLGLVNALSNYCNLTEYSLLNDLYKMDEIPCESCNVK